jgi:hypothetical protein
MSNQTKTTTVAQKLLRDIPYLNVDALQGRAVPSLSFYDGDKWHFWLILPDRLMPMQAIPAEGDYFGRSAERRDDLYFEFLNFMLQRAYWPDVANIINAIRNDIHNLAASLEKYHLFNNARRETLFDTKRFATTELEYIFSTCRSVFDLLQEIIVTLWDKVSLEDKSISKKQLRKSFSAMVLNNEKPMTSDDICSKFKIPKQLADFYARSSPFFCLLREFRDNVIHRGKSFDLLFVTDKGFAVIDTTEPFASFKVWNVDNKLPNGLASLRPVLAYAVLETINCCEDFAVTIQKIIKFPSEIAPGFKVYMRGHHNHELLTLKEVRDKSQWWNA